KKPSPMASGARRHGNLCSGDLFDLTLFADIFPVGVLKFDAWHDDKLRADCTEHNAFEPNSESGNSIRYAIYTRLNDSAGSSRNRIGPSKNPRRWPMKASNTGRPWRAWLLGLGLISVLGLTGCQFDVGGQTLPSPYYLQDD